MKLFEVNYMDDCESNYYLIVGSTNDTPEIIEQRETMRLQNKCSCFMGCWVSEISEVEGHKIFVK